MSIPLNIDIQQILLHFMNFAILFLVLYFVLYKPVKKFMAKREEYYAQMDKDAQENLSAAEATKADKIIEDARKTSEAERDRIIGEAQDEIQNLAIEAAKKLMSEDPYEQFLDLAEGSR